MDFESYQQWVEADPQNRAVTIKLAHGNVSVWVYDYKLMVGKFVNSVEDIDLVSEYRAHALAMYERAQKLVGPLKPV